MSLPRGKDARTFYRVAKQRFSDAELLLAPEHNRTTSAVYLAGYGVECMLKALLPERVPESQHNSIEGFFRRPSGHDLRLLVRELRRRSPFAVPSDIERTLVRINTWTPNLRYTAGSIRRSIADEFLRDVGRLIQWFDERI